MQERSVYWMAVVVAVPLWADWKSLPLPTNQTLGTIHVQSVGQKSYIRGHMHSAKSYSIIPSNEKSSCMLSGSSNFMMLLLVDKSCMFIHTTLSTKSNVNQRKIV